MYKAAHLIDLISEGYDFVWWAGSSSKQEHTTVDLEPFIVINVT